MCLIILCFLVLSGFYVQFKRISLLLYRVLFLCLCSFVMSSLRVFLLIGAVLLVLLA